MAIATRADTSHPGVLPVPVVRRLSHVPVQVRVQVELYQYFEKPSIEMCLWPLADAKKNAVTISQI